MQVKKRRPGALVSVFPKDGEQGPEDARYMQDALCCKNKREPHEPDSLTIAHDMAAILSAFNGLQRLCFSKGYNVSNLSMFFG